MDPLNLYESNKIRMLDLYGKYFPERNLKSQNVMK